MTRFDFKQQGARIATTNLRPRTPVERVHGKQISADCPSPRHHSVRAGEGRSGHKNAVVSHPKCVCPYTLQLMEKERARRSAQAAERSESVGTRAYLSNVAVPVSKWPDLSGGNCTKAWGIATMDAYDEAPNQGERRERAKAMCVTCPLLAECGAWITAAESPAGSWGGIYAGQTSSERANRK